MSQQEDFGPAKAIASLVFIAIIALTAIFAFFGGFFTTRETHRTVVLRNGAFMYVAGPGFHLKAPFIDSTVDFDIRLRQMAFTKAETFTIDRQHVDVDMVIQYQLPAGQIENIFRHVSDYEQRLTSLALDRMKRHMGRRNAADLPNERAEVTREIFEDIKAEAMRLYHIDVVEVQLTNIDYDQSFRQAVNQAAVLRQQIEQARQQQHQVEVAAETARIQAEGAANASIQQARGNAESRRLAATAEAQAIALRAEAEARGIQLRGEAEARSIRAQAEALAQNPSYVSLRQAERWNGALPTQMLSGSPVPFIQLQGAR